MHDGSTLVLKKLGKDYDPTDRWQALQVLADAQKENCLVTGLLYIESGRPALTDVYNLTEKPLNRLTEAELRPKRETIEEIFSCKRSQDHTLFNY